MFNRKTPLAGTTSNIADSASAAAAPELRSEERPSTPTPEKGPDMSPKTPPTPTFKPEARRPDAPPVPPRRPMGGDSPDSPLGGPGRGTQFGGGESSTRKLIVGRDIALAGEINSCDHLVVEGTVEARVREGSRIEISDTGLFRGTVEIDDADIAGRFEGDIMVRHRLRLRSTGRIVGKISYGELEVDAGGQLEGEIHGLADTGKPRSERTNGATPEPVAAIG